MKAALVNPERISMLLRTVSYLGTVNEDIVICAMKEEFMLFAINNAHTTRPVVRFKPEFFNTYEYISETPSIIYQITAKAIISNTKKLRNIQQMNWVIDNDNAHLIISIVNHTKISHTFELFLQEAIHARGDYFSTTIYQASKVKLLSVFYKELKTAFKRVHFITLSARNEKNQLYLTLSSADEDKALNDADMNIKHNNNCQIEISDPKFTETQFSLTDFKNVLKLNCIYSEYSEIFLSFQGSPVVIKSNFQNIADVESVIATMPSENAPEPSTPQELAPQMPVDNHPSSIPEPPAAQFPPEPPIYPQSVEMSQSLESSQSFAWPGSVFAPLTQEKRKIVATVEVSQSEGSSLSSSESSD